MRLNLYPGGFDPITNGHMDIIRRAAAQSDELIVAVMDNLAKTPLFTAEERVEMVRECCKDLPNVRVDSFHGLLADYVKMHGINAVFRGLRANTDFEYELQMAHLNARLCPKSETLFLMTKPGLSFLSSSMVKQVYSLGGDISELVPEEVIPHMAKIFGR